MRWRLDRVEAIMGLAAGVGPTAPGAGLPRAHDSAPGGAATPGRRHGKAGKRGAGGVALYASFLTGVNCTPYHAVMAAG